MRCLLPIALVLVLTACGSEEGGDATHAGTGGSPATGGSGGSGGSTDQDSGKPDGWTPVDGGDAGGSDAADASQPPDAPPAACDDGFSFSPAQPATGAINDVAFTFDQPLAYVGISAVGPGSAQQGNLEITTSAPWTWSWPMTFDAAGMWTFTFSAGDPSQPYGMCTKNVIDTGTPPPISTGSCAGKVCGESDGNGGTCTACPMEGSCLDPPSPYGPGGPGSWSCLDSAGCQDWGQCRIWCPGEPCDAAVHPDGCPQGVETCYVDPHFTSYEEACKACCESRHHAPTGEYACWDDAFSLCRYPSDCGKPLLNPP